MSQWNLNYLKLFHIVYTTRSMTEAAKVLHLTQSGVSQHIQSFEEDLGFPLFDRIKKRLYPNDKARELYKATEPLIRELDYNISRLRTKEEKPKGIVRIGLPIEYGNNVVIPKLAVIGENNPEINFSIVLDFATILSEQVLKGDLDFALIDRFKVDRRLKLETISTETLILCGLKSYVKKFGPTKYNAEYFSQFDYIDYKHGEPIVRKWFKHHLARHNLAIRTRANIFDVQGVAKFVLSGLGLGVLPDHLVNKFPDSIKNELFLFEGKKAALKNDICLVYLPHKTRPLAQQLILDSIRKL